MHEIPLTSKCQSLWNRKKSTEHTDWNCPGLIQAYKGGGIKPVNGILVFDSLAFELAIIWHYLINEIHFDCILSNTMTRQSKKSITNRRRRINYWNWHLESVCSVDFFLFHNVRWVLLILEELVTITVIIHFYLVGGSERWWQSLLLFIFIWLEDLNVDDI
jgi:hypothetical protein